MTKLPLSGYRRNCYPGDQVYIMRRAHTDEAGDVYPAGTEYVPVCSGVDNTRGWPCYQQVTIDGSTVRFYGPPHA